MSIERQFELGDEVVRGVRCRVFRHAPRSMPELFGKVSWDSDAAFLVYGSRRVTYRDAWKQAGILASVLEGRYRVGVGTRVGLAMRNMPEWVMSFLAIARLGAVPVVLNSRSAGEELAHARDTMGVSLIIVDGRCGRELISYPSSTPTLVAADAAAEGDDRVRDAQSVAATVTAGAASLEALVDETGTAVNPPAPVVSPEDPAMILFTSGTTGRAKGAVLSHFGTCSSVWTNHYAGYLIAERMAARFGITVEQLLAHAPQPALLLMFPLFHTSGVHTGLLANLMRGGKIVLMRRWDVPTALTLIEREKITQFPCVPTMLWDLVRSPELSRFDMSSLTSVSAGGQALQSGLLAEITRAFPRAIPGTGFGMTETTGAVAMCVGEDFLAHPGTAGRILPTTEVRIRRDDGQVAGNGETGEICLRGVSNMLEYWGEPEETARAFDEDGFMHSGDIGYIDAEGYLYIVDRKKDMVISAGENIYCAEVERVLLSHPDLIEAAAFGIPDPRLGERLLAIVVPRPGAVASVTPQAIREHVAAHLAAYKVPADIQIEAAGLPRNDLDKVDKNRLRDRYRTASTKAGAA